VSNLLSKGRGQWPDREFNAVLRDFYNKSLPAAKALGVSVELRDKSVPIQKFLSERAWRRLRSFSECANRDVLHPSDTEQWSAFLALAYLDRTELTSERLRDWLTKEQGWPGDSAYELMNRFEDGMELLAVYDQAQAAPGRGSR
jgi:hypothetical protein